MSGDEWSLDDDNIGGTARNYADALARAYLAAPTEHEGRLEKLLNGACKRARIDPATLVEQIFRTTD